MPASVARLGALCVATATISGTKMTFALVRKPAVEAGVVFRPYISSPKNTHSSSPSTAPRATTEAVSSRSLLRKMTATATNAMPKRSATMPNGGMEESPTCIMR